MSVPIRRFVNVNVAFANFVDGESVGNESIDTNGNLYEWQGPALGWVQTRSGGAALVSQTADSQWAYGNWPNTLFDAGSFVGAADAATITLTNLESYDLLTLAVSAFTATALNITVSVDGTNFVAYLPTKDSFNTTPAAIAATGVYFVRGKFSAIKLTQSGAGGVSCQFSHGVVG